MVFAGCFENGNLGLEPSGRIFVNTLKTQKAVYDSSEFHFEVYKDFELTQMIAKLEPGSRLFNTEVKPGILSNLAMNALVSTV